MCLTHCWKYQISVSAFAKKPIVNFWCGNIVNASPNLFISLSIFLKILEKTPLKPHFYNFFYFSSY